jgi:hypothetical protein
MRIDNILRNSLRRRWGKYYLCTEVEGFFSSLLQVIAPEHKELKDLRELFSVIQHEREEQKETIADLKKCAVKATEMAGTKTQEVLHLSEQLVKGQVENARLSEQMAQQAVELARLQTRADKLGELLATVERQSPANQMFDAESKAKHLLDKARDDKDLILRQSYEKRSRMIAASRAAYYHALQFKQDLADHYHRMEENLNASINVLRQSEMIRFAPQQDEDTPIGDLEQVSSP